MKYFLGFFIAITTLGLTELSADWRPWNTSSYGNHSTIAHSSERYSNRLISKSTERAIIGGFVGVNVATVGLIGGGACLLPTPLAPLGMTMIVVGAFYQGIQELVLASAFYNWRNSKGGTITSQFYSGNWIISPLGRSSSTYTSSAVGV